MKKSHLIRMLAVCSVAIIALLSQRDIIRYSGFTGNDTLTLIETSRINNFHDFIRVLESPLMAGSTFVKRHLYYRPVSSLSFSLDYAIWDLDPFGYHLTNLILHALVSLFVFFTFRMLSHDEMISWFASILFAANPLIVETVPSPARRQDILAALFLLFSFLLYLKSVQIHPRKIKFMVLSLGCYLLALCSKENAIFMPVLVLAYAFLFLRTDQPLSKRLIRAMKSAGPYFIVTLVFLAWRILILGSVGKYDGPPIRKIPWASLMILEGYSETLFRPVISLFYPVTDASNRYALILVLSIFIIFLLAYRHFRGMNRRLAFITLILFGISGMFILARPIFFYMIAHGYQGNGILAHWMEGRNVLSLESYRVIMDNIISAISMSGLVLALVLSMVLYGQALAQKQLLVLLTVWLLLPLGLHLITVNFSARNLYIPLIPFSGCLAVLCAEGFRQIRAVVTKREATQIPESNIFLSMITLAVLIPFFIYTPLIRKYEDWRNYSRLSSDFLKQVSSIAAQLGKNSELVIDEFPVLSETDPYDVQSEGFLLPHTIQSWLNLQFPHSGFTVRVGDTRKFTKLPMNLSMELSSIVDHRAIISVHSNTD